MPNQFVTLVASGGTPVRLADQSGTPYPTTGTGSLVFATGPTLVNPILINPTIEPGEGGVPNWQQAMLDRSVRPTGGGAEGGYSQIATGGYTHFMRTGRGLNNRIIGSYYHGTTHGQDDPEGICLYQAGIDGLSLVIDGNAASGGTVTLAVPTRISLTSRYNLSYMTFTVYGSFLVNGVPAASYTMTGPNAGRVFTPGTVLASEITAIVPNDDTIGDVAAGLYATPANVEVKYSDDGGSTWSAPIKLIDGLDTGTARGYQTAVLASRTGTVVVLVYQTNLVTNVSSTVRFVSEDNGETFGPARSVTFTGLVGTDTRFTLYSPWRQTGDGTFISVGTNGENTYWAETTDGAVIDCTLFAVTDYAAANTNSWQITAIDGGTDTITLAPGLGNVTAYFPANMAVTVAGAGAADGATYVLSSSWDGTNTLVVVNALVGGTIGADSRLRQTYGPAQVLSADAGANSISLMYDQRANFNAGHFFGVSGSSGGGAQNIDGFHEIESVSYNAGTNRTTLVLADALDGVTVGFNCRTTNVGLGEWGFDLLTDRTRVACPRTNGQVSQIPIFASDDAGVTTRYLGHTNIPEGSYVSFTLDFVEAGGITYTLIGGYQRGPVDSFFLMAADSNDLFSTLQTFSDPYYWLATGGTFPNSGYPYNTIFGNTAVITYGIETGLNFANLRCQRIQLASLFNPLAAVAPTLISGRYYGNPLAGAATSQILVENRLTLVPIPAPMRRTTIDQLAAYVSNATGVTTSCQFRFGIYADNGGTPQGGALLLDAGVVNMTGLAGLASVDIDDFVVGPGVWWLAVIGNLNGGGGSMPQIRASASPGPTQNMLGTDTGNYNSWARYLYNEQTIASWGTYTLPETCPTMTYADSVASTNAVQLVYRKA